MQPTKHEIITVMKKLKSLSYNKQCFDCGAANPTWASVTYGVFLCIDCSAVHRSLGVHLSFIRSTQLDTNWTWVQLRAMQVGGNQNALAFFLQNNCRESDIQRKYQSRAAQLYRTKLEKLAVEAAKIYGTKLHIDVSEEKYLPIPDDVDFFEQPTDASVNGASLSNDARAESVSAPDGLNFNVDDLTKLTDPSLSSAVSSRKDKASKTKTKKGGLGASKLDTDFTAIVMAAEDADSRKEKQGEPINTNFNDHLKSEQQNLASLRLAYKDISEERQQQEESLKSSDPTRAKQVERLGMGKIGSRNKAISHSAFSGIQRIEQEGATTTHSSILTSSNMDPFYSFSSSKNNFFGQSSSTSIGWATGKSTGDDWTVRDLEVSNNATTEPKSDLFRLQKTPELSRSSHRAPGSMNASLSKADKSDNIPDDITKKFANATSISSDAFFGRDTDEPENLSRFQGSASISSDDYFGRPKPRPSYVSTEFQQIKEGVRQGVTKVADRLSNLASGVVHNLQDRFG